MNGAFYQEEARRTPRFKPSGSNSASSSQSKQQIFSTYVKHVSNLKSRLAHSHAAAKNLNDFCNRLDTKPENQSVRADFISELAANKYIDDVSGHTYRKDMLGDDGILPLLTKLDAEVGIANNFVAGLGHVGTAFIRGLDIYIGKAINASATQAETESLKHIQRKGDFILTVDSQTAELNTMSDQVSLKINLVHKHTKDSHRKRTDAIKACLVQLQSIDELEATNVTATINDALNDANRMGAMNRVLNAANLAQLDRDKKNVMNDVERSMEPHKRFVPQTVGVGDTTL